ncbi:Zn(2)-Cys(6) binuclear cluster domain-containing protein [Roridomyces roridus]|uniref:Zn(2)-Cys(6) binuclear cluster domain-containing protein n=1 Tax=Roridomyces roridus TaxID=1738132 RepID=A0AAD7FKJ6_9AGAR|nr:Zn(2)-Cys(6) binuclear cluster domain-containing protein [Roridomyces roridus]
MSNTLPEKNLKRGQACYNCRRRKMVRSTVQHGQLVKVNQPSNQQKCDGVHPVCGQCARANRPDDCEYVGEYAQARVQILQENIARVEQRIYELEHPTEVPPVTTVQLHKPYAPAKPLYSPENDIFRTRSEPPIDMLQTLLDRFLPYASDFGFFIHVPSFRRSAVKKYPLGHDKRPAPSLLFAACLWGLRFSPPALQVHEPSCLARTLSLASTDLASSHPYKALHTLQAEILLAHYFFSSGRFVEGKYHTAAAVALALSSSLHSIRSANVNAPSVGMIPPPRDAVEEGERIHACWMTVILDNLWATALKQEPARDLRNESRSSSFDTPWPLELHDYEQGKMHPSARYSQTVQTFLTGPPETHRMSTMTGLAKGSLLWQQADKLARSWNPVMPPTQVPIFQATFYALDVHIESFRTALGSPGTVPNPTPAMTRALIVAHSIGHAATIQLHSIAAVNAVMDSRRKRLSSARAVLEIVAETAPRQGTVNAYINPVMGTVWMIACQAVMDEIPQLKVRSPQESMVLTSLLARAVSAMAVFVETCPLLKYQISRIQEASRGL